MNLYSIYFMVATRDLLYLIFINKMFMQIQFSFIIWLYLISVDAITSKKICGRHGLIIVGRNRRNSREKTTFEIFLKYSISNDGLALASQQKLLTPPLLVLHMAKKCHYPALLPHFCILRYGLVFKLTTSQHFVPKLLMKSIPSTNVKCHGFKIFCGKGKGKQSKTCCPLVRRVCGLGSDTASRTIGPQTVDFQQRLRLLPRRNK